MSTIRKRNGKVKNSFQLDFSLVGKRVRKNFSSFDEAEKYKKLVDGKENSIILIKEFSKYDLDPPKEMLEIKKLNLRCYLQKIVNIKKAIYFLYKNRKLIYIGMTCNLLHRLFASEHREKDFDDVYFIEFDKSKDVRTLESLLIFKYSPPLNKIGKCEELFGMFDNIDLRIQKEFLKLYGFDMVDAEQQLNGAKFIKMIPDGLPNEIKIQIQNSK